MQKIIDFHIHSKYSRATSKAFDLNEILKWSEIKGVDIISAADFTHPAWFKILQNNLTEDKTGSGLYQLNNSKSKIRFILATEISCIYSQNGKTRRVHLCILMPSLSAVARFNQALADRGAKLASDGRPILGISAKEILQIALEADENSLVIPAHVWTPWFAVFGSKSGFDSLVECFEDLTPHISALETGLSSDPLMNWLWSDLDDLLLLSNSDAHSGPHIGREANIFDLSENSFSEFAQIIKNKDKNKFLATIEFYPELGMYHFDGHRACNFSCSPNDTFKKYKGICPKCKKALTLGVLSQVEKLADRDIKLVDKIGRVPFKSIVPLPEIIADYYGVGRSSKKVNSLFQELIAKGANEFNILLDLDLEELKKIMPTDLALGIMRMRQGNIEIVPGFDGQYGEALIFSDTDKKSVKVKASQVTLFD
jgi:uncharacterized protein (TIGR00375 family)